MQGRSLAFACALALPFAAGGCKVAARGAAANRSEGTDAYARIVENRFRGTSYDAGAGKWGGGLPADGVALWHIVEDPAAFDGIALPTAGQGDWGRRGIRLVRRNGGAPTDDAQALLDSEGAALSPRWVDGRPSGFRVELASAVGPRVRVRVSMSRLY